MMSVLEAFPLSLQSRSRESDWTVCTRTGPKMCCVPKAADISGHAGIFPVVARCWCVRKQVSTAASSHLLLACERESYCQRGYPK